MKEITFDSFVRGALWVAGAVALIWMVNSLSGVLLPFFLAWLLAYMMYPLVKFFQYRCRLRHRALAIAAAIVTVLAMITLVALLVIPPTVTEVMKLRGVAVDFFSSIDISFANRVRRYINNYLDNNTWMSIIQQGGVLEGIKAGINQLWHVVTGTIDFAMGLFSTFICLLYMVFILQDYEKMSEGWIHLLPRRSRPMCMAVARDVESGMNAYFRGQALVALCVGVLFSIGFLIIGFPMAIGLGMFIGALNLVPYLQLIGFVPTILLALIKSAETGQNFWGIFGLALLVFAVVQVIQDMFLVPRIMGKVMGLKPAIILLALSVWGSILGFIGLIIALPLTTILISYYRQIIAHYDKEDYRTSPHPCPQPDSLRAMGQD